jgi:hypothetical protein
MDAMNISFGSSIKKGTVEISGNTSALDENKFKDSDLNAVVTVKVCCPFPKSPCLLRLESQVVNQTTRLQEHSEFKVLDDMTGVEIGTPRFNEVYGDCYISGMYAGCSETQSLALHGKEANICAGFIEGGEFTGIVSMKVLDRDKVESITSTLKSTINSQAQATDFVLDPIRSSTFSSSTTASTHDTETTISVSWMGGGMIKEGKCPLDL